MKEKKKKVLYAPTSARDPCLVTVINFDIPAGVTPTTRNPVVFGLAGNADTSDRQCTASITAALLGFAAIYLLHTYMHVVTWAAMYALDWHLRKRTYQPLYHTSYLPHQPSLLWPLSLARAPALSQLDLLLTPYVSEPSSYLSRCPTAPPTVPRHVFFTGLQPPLCQLPAKPFPFPRPIFSARSFSHCLRGLCEGP